MRKLAFFTRAAGERPPVPHALRLDEQLHTPCLMCVGRIQHSVNRVTLVATCFHTEILLDLFYPEDGGDMFLRNIL
jgi:hypothetical protein